MFLIKLYTHTLTPSLSPCVYLFLSFFLSFPSSLALFLSPLLQSPELYQFCWCFYLLYSLHTTCFSILCEYEYEPHTPNIPNPKPQIQAQAIANQSIKASQSMCQQYTNLCVLIYPHLSTLLFIIINTFNCYDTIAQINKSMSVQCCRHKLHWYFLLDKKYIKQ